MPVRNSASSRDRRPRAPRRSPAKSVEPGRAVEQRQPVEQRRRADRADDQVLQARLERVLAPHLASRTARRAGSTAARSRGTASTRFCAATSTTMPSDDGQQQRVVLAVRRPRAAPRARHDSSTAAMPADAEDQRQRERQVVDRAARRTTRSSCSSHCQIAEPERRAERDDRQRPARARCADERARAAARPAARRSAPPSSATSGDSAAQSMCGPLGGGERSSRPRAPTARRRALATRLPALAALERELRVEREREDREHERHEHEPSRSDISRDSTVGPDAVVHRADEQPQRVDATPAPRR